MAELEKKIKVLYIDDEQHNLDSFRAAFRREFEVFTALDAFEGKKIVQSEEIHVVIADQRMPGTTGVEFFEQLMEINPEPMRILLTGYSDIQSVIDAINKGEVYRFIDKPWSWEVIKNAVLNAFEIYSAKKELKEKTAKLEKIQSEMNRFVYSLSHDLRGPLMSISGVSRMAREEISSPEVHEYLNLIDKGVQKLDQYIYKILDFYRSTKIENKIDAIDFGQVLQQQMEAYQAKWDLSKARIITEVSQSGIFYSDDAKIRVILNNLFSNAINFRKDSSDALEIKISVQADDIRAKISIQDNGHGIEAHHLPYVFNMFHRASQKNVGSGIGLYMVKESVEQLGGDVFLSSTPGKGTSVEVILPNWKE